MLEQLLLALIGVGASACGSSETYVLENTGRVCLHTVGSARAVADTVEADVPQQFVADAPIALTFVTGECFGSCQRDRVARADLTADGATHTLTTFASWTDVSGEGGACSSACDALFATAVTAPLAAGTYRFAWGDRVATLEVPSQHPAPLCMDR